MYVRVCEICGEGGLTALLDHHEGDVISFTARFVVDHQLGCCVNPRWGLFCCFWVFFLHCTIEQGVLGLGAPYMRHQIKHAHIYTKHS